MALKIKEGSAISPYGASANSFNSETDLSQSILEHLQTRFPDDIEDDSFTVKVEIESETEVVKEPAKKSTTTKAKKD